MGGGGAPRSLTIGDEQPRHNTHTAAPLWSLRQLRLALHQAAHTADKNALGRLIAGCLSELGVNECAQAACGSACL